MKWVATKIMLSIIFSKISIISWKECIGIFSQIFLISENWTVRHSNVNVYTAPNAAIYFWGICRQILKYYCTFFFLCTFKTRLVLLHWETKLIFFTFSFLRWQHVIKTLCKRKNFLSVVVGFVVRRRWKSALCKAICCEILARY